jgi:hypothetical protein
VIIGSPSSTTKPRVWCVESTGLVSFFCSWECVFLKCVCVDCPHLGALYYRLDHCLECGTGIVVPPKAQIAREQEIREAGEANLRTIIVNDGYVDLDVLWSEVLLRGVGDRQIITNTSGRLTSSRKVTPLEGLEDYGETYSLFIEHFVVALPGDPRTADRLGWPNQLRRLAKTYTTQSVLEYDRQFRRDNPAGLWGKGVNQFLLYLLEANKGRGSASKKGAEESSPKVESHTISEISAVEGF